MMRGGVSRRVLPAAIVVVASVLLPGSAFALSCAPRQFTLNEAYQAADSIVVGLVTECEDTSSRSAWTGDSGCSFVSLEVLKEASPARDYGGSANSQACGLSFYVGNQYLLFLDGENRPLFYGAPLSGDHPSVELAGAYLEILRDFRDGASRELSEPWIAGEQEGTCFLSHRVGGHSILFSRRTADAPEWPQQTWTPETVDGRTVYRSRISRSTTGPSAMDMELVATTDFSHYTPDMQMLQINLQEWQPVPLRRATLSVGTRVWPLERLEAFLSRGNWQADRMVDYRLVGEVTEEILSAMLRPSDVVVSASLLPSAGVGPKAPAAAAAPVQKSPGHGASVTTRLEPGPTDDALVPSVPEQRPHEPVGEPPPAVLRLETRSTELARAIDRYRDCYGGS